MSKKLLLLLLCVPLIGLGQINQKLNSNIKNPCDCVVKLSEYMKDLYNLSLPYDDVNQLLDNKSDKDKVIECFNNYTEITVFCVQSFDKSELDNCSKSYFGGDNEDIYVEELGETIKFYGEVLMNFMGKIREEDKIRRINAIKETNKMKKLLLILLCVPLIGLGQGQVNCSLLDVTDVVIDNNNMTIDIAVYNGDTMDTHYPFIAYTIDALGDTIQNGNITWFVTPALDTSWYNYNILNSITPIYPLSVYFVYSNFTGPNPGEDTCILSYHPSCDSVITSFTQIDSSTTPHLIHFDIQTFGLSNGNFGYGGFVLIDDLGDTIAFENINTAANVFGPMEYDTDSRILDVVQNFTLPFSGTLHLISGWFAGNSSTSCIFPFNISIGTTDISGIINARKLLKITDILGRETPFVKNTPLFYIYDDGTVEKEMIIE